MAWLTCQCIFKSFLNSLTHEQSILWSKTCMTHCCVNNSLSSLKNWQRQTKTCRFSFLETSRYLLLHIFRMYPSLRILSFAKLNLRRVSIKLNWYCCSLFNVNVKTWSFVRSLNMWTCTHETFKDFLSKIIIFTPQDNAFFLSPRLLQQHAITSDYHPVRYTCDELIE